MLSKKTRLIFFIAAGVLILTAIAWSMLLSGGEGGRLCEQINAYGYKLYPDDLYAAGSWQSTSIRALLPTENLTDDLPAAIAASTRAGFRSDVDSVGAVSLIMANPHDNDAITLYLLNGEVELAFVQRGGAIVALGE